MLGRQTHRLRFRRFRESAGLGPERVLQEAAIDALRQQRLEVFEGGGSGQLGEDVAQVREGLEPVGFGRLDHAVEVGAGLGTPHAVGKQPVGFPSAAPIPV
jgi:hypothetical protein